MKQLIDSNPLTGERCYMTIEDGKLHITNEQDTDGILESATDLRNRDGYSQRGIKNDHWHYARIPNGVMLEMAKKYGVDMMAPKVDWPAVFKCINAHYPWLKTTTKTHA